MINCRGTLTVISGSLELPEVRAAWRPPRSITWCWTN